MAKPNTLKDLLFGGHIDMSDVREVARGVFDGKSDGIGPPGYVVKPAAFDDLDDRLQSYAVKIVLEFKVENVLDLEHDG